MNHRYFILAIMLGGIVLATGFIPNKALAGQGHLLAATHKPDNLPSATNLDPAAFLAPPVKGKKAPVFSTQDALGKPLSLSQYLGKKNVVLIFYSGSTCPICAQQLSNLQSHLADFQFQDAEILAISADDAQHAKQTLGEYGLGFKVIPDKTHQIIKMYGISNPNKHGKAWPASFIIDKKGILRMCVADPEGKRLHSNELLPELSKITKKPAPKLEYDE